MSNLTPSEVLAMAANDCEVNWCQSTNEDTYGNRCMLGAINFVAGVPVEYYSDIDWEGSEMPDPNPDALALRDAALDRLISSGAVPNNYADRRYMNRQSQLVSATFEFNDANDQDTVVAALRAAAQ